VRTRVNVFMNRLISPDAPSSPTRRSVVERNAPQERRASSAPVWPHAAPNGATELVHVREVCRLGQVRFPVSICRPVRTGKHDGVAIGIT